MHTQVKPCVHENYKTGRTRKQISAQGKKIIQEAVKITDTPCIYIYVELINSSQ